MLKFLLVVLLTAGAVFAGYKYLSIDLNALISKADPENVEPVVTSQTLPVEEVSPAEAAPADPDAERKEWALNDVRNRIQVHGGEVLDSRVFDDKTACDNAVRAVGAEYARRGIPATDMAETAAFPGSTGAVIMLNNDGNLFYVGCIARESNPWAIYVQFRQ